MNNSTEQLIAFLRKNDGINDKAKLATLKETVPEILGKIEDAREMLRSCPVIPLGDGETARDLRFRSVSATDVRILMAAAEREGACFITHCLKQPHRNSFRVMVPWGSPEQITAFMKNYAPTNGLRGVYGTPSKGFAGGFTTLDDEYQALKLTYGVGEDCRASVMLEMISSGAVSLKNQAVARWVAELREER